MPSRWFTQEPHLSAIKRGMAWAAENPPAETDLDELLARAEAKRSSDEAPSPDGEDERGAQSTKTSQQL
jgi:hypothetical protein